MLRSRYPHPVQVVVFIWILGFAGCTPTTRPEVFRNSFLPPSPRPAEAPPEETLERVAEPPQLQALYSPKEFPNFLRTEPNVPPRPQLDIRIRRAEERFQAGKRAYLDGDLEAARTEFDRAVDILLASSTTAPDRHLMERKLEDLVDRIYRYDLDGLGAGVTDEEARQYEKSPLQEFLDLTFPIDPSLKNKVSEQIKATLSQLPLEVNDEVLRYVNYFNSERGRRTLVGGLKRAGRFKEMIRRILDEEGVPREMIYLAQAESGFLPRAISPKAAAGMWQFVKFRGQEYGLLQTPYSDDRLDPEKATRAGARHLKDLYQQFGDWHLAMAAYNCGPGCVARGVERTGYADFWQLRSRGVLPKETSNYVPLILALTIVAKNAADYGIEMLPPDPPLLYDTVEMIANTNLSLISDILDSPVAELRELNPALLRGMAPAGYALRIPRGRSGEFMARLSQFPADKRASWRLHRVAEGESLASLSKRYNLAPSLIESVNTVGVRGIRQGDAVLIPAKYTPETRTVRAAAPSKRTVASRSRTPRARSAATASKSGQSGASKPPIRRASDGAGIPAKPVRGATVAVR